MSRAPRLSTRLTRSPFSVGSYASLWQGPDHLLQVQSYGFRELYQRLDYKDVDAFVLVASNRRKYWALTWGSLAAVLAFVFLLNWVSGDGFPFVSLSFLVLCLIPLTWNWLLGPTVRVYALTAAQPFPLLSLVRRRRAEAVLTRLRPLLEDEPSPSAPTPPS